MIQLDYSMIHTLMNISLEVGTLGVQSQNMLQRDYSMIHTLIMSSECGTIGVYSIIIILIP